LAQVARPLCRPPRGTLLVGMARVLAPGLSAGGLGQDPAMSWGGKMQRRAAPHLADLDQWMMSQSELQSPTMKAARSFGGSRSGFLKGIGSAAATAKNQKRSASATHFEVLDVRGLTGDMPVRANEDPGSANRGEHGNLMMRLKSREARAKAESNREFLAKYRKSGEPDAKADDFLDKLLRATAARSDELKRKSEEYQVEAADAERKLERANAQGVSRANETELQAMNPFERSQSRIKEDKREEELQKLRDEARANYVRVHRRLQNELIERRDYKVLLVEFRRLRLEKLQETLGRVRDGRRLRSCVREMIRHGAQKILNRLEQASVPLETWMREVLVNSCHLELRIEDAEAKLLKLRRLALTPVKDEIQEMVGASKEGRFEALCQRTWENRRSSSGGDEMGQSASSFRHPSPHQGDDGDSDHRYMISTQGSQGFNTTGQSFTSGPNAGFRGTTSMNGTGKSFVTRVPDDIAAEMQTVEADIVAVKRLLTDMRGNAAAVICHQIREAEKSGGKGVGKDALDEGFRNLKLLINEEFAKTTQKELQKSAPHGKVIA